MQHLANLHVLILGLGDSGLAMARWCARHGVAGLRVWDSRSAPPQQATLAADVPEAQFFSGPLTAESLGPAQLVLKSPGLSPLDERLAPLLAAAQRASVVVAGELDLFARALADLKADRGYAPQVLAITGTNGKTTTTSLTGQLVERTGRRVAVAGNIGPTLLGTLTAALDAQAQADAEAVYGVADTAAAPVAWVEAAPSGASSTSLQAGLPSECAGAADVAPAGVDDVGATEATDPPPTPVPDDAAPLVLAPPPPKVPVFAHLPQVWVLELSSFQLDGVRGFEPSAAAVLNVTQDHLDWHGDMAAYAQTKARIFGDRAVMVINRDDALVDAMVPAPVLMAGARGKPKRLVGRAVCRFGLDAPRHPGDFGLVTENGMAWLVRAMPADETIKRKTRPPGRRAAAFAPPGGIEDLGRPGVFEEEIEEITLQRLMPADALRIRGRHNAANALAALALATAVGCPLAPMLHGLREYRGEPHRVELVGQVGGVEAFDDSKGTNVGATVAALNGLGADRLTSRLVVILGGDGKGQDFAPLAEPIARHARAVATLGRDAEAIEAALAATGVALQRHATLEVAVAWSFAQAQEGDAVLLSPACASLDMFRNYAHRAEVFVAAVQALAAERGEILA